MNYLEIPADSTILSAFFHPAGNDAPILIVCHGFCGSIDGGSSILLAGQLQSLGIATLRFGFSPHQCLSRQVLEIAAAINYCRHELSSSLALLGRSMGAAASLAYAATDPRLAGLCLMACPADLAGTFRPILGDAYTQLESGQSVIVYHDGQPVPLTPSFIHDFAHYDLPAAASSLAGFPLLLIHGEQDLTVPLRHGRQLFAVAPQPKMFLSLPEVAHSFTGCAKQFMPALVDWLTKTVFPTSISRAEEDSHGRVSG